MTSVPFSGRSNDDSYAAARRSMVQKQLTLRGIRDQRVLEAMQDIPRHQFVPERNLAEAYEDWPLAIGYGQTISQPYTVAFMAQSLKLRGDEKVLEIGAGSGYGAAVLSRLAREVHTVERIPELASAAQDTLARLGFHNVHVHTSDGSMGLASEAPFAAIVVTAGADQLPPPLVEQLADDGRLVIPIGESAKSQKLMRYTKSEHQLAAENLGLFAFVPLLGKHGRAQP